MEEFPLPNLSKIATPCSSTVKLQIMRRIQELLDLKRMDVFPGSQPVSFASQNLQNLLREDYLVCEKSDGVRYLIFLFKIDNIPQLFFIDRKYEIHQIPLSFPVGNGEYHHETLIDGELVVDIIKQDDQPPIHRLRFYIFDLLIINSKNVMQENLYKRLAYAQSQVVQPLISSEYYKKKFPFGLKIKNMYKAYRLDYVFKEVLPKLEHGNDGLIFTPVNHPYILRTCNKMLKWKPALLNTVDFVLSKIDYIYTIFTFKQGELEFYDYFEADAQLEEYLKKHPLDTTIKGNFLIIECRYDPEWETPVPSDIDDIRPETVKYRAGGWRFVRVRTDKNTPNDINVVHKILKSIDDDVTESELLSICKDSEKNWKERETEKDKEKESKTDKNRESKTDNDKDRESEKDRDRDGEKETKRKAIQDEDSNIKRQRNKEE